MSLVMQQSVDALIVAVRQSADILMAIAVLLTFTVIVFSTVIYFAERGTYDSSRKLFVDVDGLPSKFDSIPATCWFVAEIITTIGLGDMTPKTSTGKIMSFPLMLVGLLIIALPSIVIGRNFAEAINGLRYSPALPDKSSAQDILVELQKQNALLTELVRSMNK